MDNNNYGCITEQGCMGLGFTPVDDKDLQKLSETLKEEYNKEKSEDIDH